MIVSRYNDGILFEAENADEFRTLMGFLKLFERVKYGPRLVAQQLESLDIQAVAETYDD